MRQRGPNSPPVPFGNFISEAVLGGDLYPSQDWCFLRFHHPHESFAAARAGQHCSTTAERPLWSEGACSLSNNQNIRFFGSCQFLLRSAGQTNLAIPGDRGSPLPPGSVIFSSFSLLLWARVFSHLLNNRVMRVKNSHTGTAGNPFWSARTSRVNQDGGWSDQSIPQTSPRGERPILL